MQSRFRLGMAPLRDGTFVSLIVLMWAVTFAGYLYSEFINNPAGIPLLTKFLGADIDLSQSAYHRWGKDTRWAVVTPMLFILSPILYLTFRLNRRWPWRRIILVMALLYPVFGALKLSRSDIMIGWLNVAFTEFCYRRYTGRHVVSLSLRKLVLFALLALTILGGTLSARIGSSDYNAYAHAIGLKFAGGPRWMELVAQVYGYAALPFENFHQFYSTYPGGFHPGISVLRPFLSMVMQGRMADEMIKTIPFTAVSTAAGSHTFLTMPYAELGMAGVLLVPVLYGVLMAVLYSRLRVNPTFVNVFVYTNFMFPWLFLYFGNGFSVLTFYLNSAVVVALLFLRYLLLPDRMRALNPRRTRSISTIPGNLPT
jgi:hypothetical protein